MKPLEEMGKFKTVVVDPPWNTGGYMSKSNHDRRVWTHVDHDYQTLSIDEIQSIPISKVIRSDAWVFLWTTSRMLPEAFGVISRWGLQYGFTMTWVKPHGPKPFGFPIYNSEQIVVGKAGAPKFLETKGFRLANVWESPRIQNSGWGRQVDNSSKPFGFYDLLRRVTPGPRLDVFGRRRIAGFQSWGDQAPEGPAPPNVYQQVLDLSVT